MASLANIREAIDQLHEKVDKLYEKIEQINKNLMSSDHLEAVAAKIINETQKELQKWACDKEIIEKIKKEVTTLNLKDKKPFEGKYSYPNYGVGNEELGSSKNLSSMSWPEDYFKSE